MNCSINNHLFYFRYTYDITRSMFSSGNISEKLRVASFDCTGEVVVDLYAGKNKVELISLYSSLVMLKYTLKYTQRRYFD